MATGISNDYEISRTATVGLGSAVAGAAIVGSIAKTSKYFKNRAQERLDSEEQLRKG